MDLDNAVLARALLGKVRRNVVLERVYVDEHVDPLVRVAPIIERDVTLDVGLSEVRVLRECLNILVEWALAVLLVLEEVESRVERAAVL